MFGLYRAVDWTLGWVAAIQTPVVESVSAWMWADKDVEPRKVTKENSSDFDDAGITVPLLPGAFVSESEFEGLPTKAAVASTILVEAAFNGTPSATSDLCKAAIAETLTTTVTVHRDDKATDIVDTRVSDSAMHISESANAALQQVVEKSVEAHTVVACGDVASASAPIPITPMRPDSQATMQKNGGARSRAATVFHSRAVPMYNEMARSAPLTSTAIRPDLNRGRSSGSLRRATITAAQDRRMAASRDGSLPSPVPTPPQSPQFKLGYPAHSSTPSPHKGSLARSTNPCPSPSLLSKMQSRSPYSSPSRYIFSLSRDSCGVSRKSSMSSNFSAATSRSRSSTISSASSSQSSRSSSSSRSSTGFAALLSPDFLRSLEPLPRFNPYGRQRALSMTAIKADKPTPLDSTAQSGRRRRASISTYLPDKELKALRRGDLHV